MRAAIPRALLALASPSSSPPTGEALPAPPGTRSRRPYTAGIYLYGQIYLENEMGIWYVRCVVI